MGFLIVSLSDCLGPLWGALESLHDDLFTPGFAVKVGLLDYL